MATTVPNDKSGKQVIDQFNREMRSQPWYQAYFAERGLDQNKVKLSKKQREELEGLALANGAPPDAFDDMMIDPAGNLNTEHGFASLPTWAKVAIGAGAVAGGFFAAPAVAGALGVGGTTAAPAATVAGGTGTIGSGMAVAAPTLGGYTGTMGGVSAALKTASTLSKVGDIASAGSKAIGSATQAAGQNRRDDEDSEYRAAALNMQGANAQAQADKEARANLYRASVLKNPVVSPNNPRGVPTFSPEMMEGYSNFEKAALAQAASAPTRKPFTPYTPNLKKSTMEQIGTYAAPAMSAYGTISKLLR